MDALGAQVNYTQAGPAPFACKSILAIIELRITLVVLTMNRSILLRRGLYAR